MLNTPFSPWPSFTQEETQAVSRILLSNRVNYWTGEEGRQFESEFAKFTGCRFAVATANGTVSLDLALKALGIGCNDEVIVTSRTFLASASCIVNAGAVPVFADVDVETQNITADTIRPVIREKTRAIICVHFAGWACDMDSIGELANEHGLYLIEDCAQAHGAKYKGKSVGSIGDIGTWSFCQDKIITTGGEGGMVTTNDQSLWEKMWSYKDHGKSWAALYGKEHPPGFRWLHESFGTNWRMTEMQAAIGRIQLERMNDWHMARVRNLEAIWSTARECRGLKAPKATLDVEHAAYKCYVLVEPDELTEGWDRDRILTEINKLGVPCYSGSCSEVYLEKAFDNTGWRPEKRLPVAKYLGDNSLMFLVHPTLSETEIEKTCDALKAVMEYASS